MQKLKKCMTGALLLGLTLLICGCEKNNTPADTSGDGGNSPVTTEPTVTEAPADLKTYSWDEAAVYEAENGTLLGNTNVNTLQDITFVEGFKDENDGVTIPVQITEAGFYDIAFVCKSSGGDYKENNVLLDDENIGRIVTEGNEYQDVILSRIYLEEGGHTVKVMKYWGWIMLDSIKLKKSDDLDPAMYKIDPILVNENASENTRRVMKYLCDIYGTDIISGQFCDSGMYGSENATIWKTTNKFPAILGLDLMDYSPSRVEMGASSKTIDYALEYWEEGGLVTFCWHWNAPTKYITGKWYSAFYSDSTNIDLGKIMSGKEEEGYRLLMEDIDAIAAQLKILNDADVPVLWRPLHEASGGWFWWGNSGAEAYKQLYILLYDKLTNEYGLNNLIWVWNGQDKDWYPGDKYVDIIGEDIYPGEHVYSPQTAAFFDAQKYTDAKKMIILSENGCLFDPELAIRDGSMWGSFSTWGGEFVSDGGSVHTYSDKYTEEYMLKKVYEHEHVITRDELPDLKNYPLD